MNVYPTVQLVYISYYILLFSWSIYILLFSWSIYILLFSWSIYILLFSWSIYILLFSFSIYLGLLLHLYLLKHLLFYYWRGLDLQDLLALKHKQVPSSASKPEMDLGDVIELTPEEVRVTCIIQSHATYVTSYRTRKILHKLEECFC